MKKLIHLHLDEVSGVADPASGLPGFVLRKSAEGMPKGVVVQRIDGGTTPGFYIAVEGIEERLGADHFDQVVGCFTEMTKAYKARHDFRDGSTGRFAREERHTGQPKIEKAGTPWRHLGAAIMRGA